MKLFIYLFINKANIKRFWHVVFSWVIITIVMDQHLVDQNNHKPIKELKQLSIIFIHIRSNYFKKGFAIKFWPVILNTIRLLIYFWLPQVVHYESRNHKFSYSHTIYTLWYVFFKKDVSSVYLYKYEQYSKSFTQSWMTLRTFLYINNRYLNYFSCSFRAKAL